MMKRSISDQSLSKSSEDSKLAYLVNEKGDDIFADPLSPDLKSSGGGSGNSSGSSTPVTSHPPPCNISSISSSSSTKDVNSTGQKSKDGFLIPDLPASALKGGTISSPSESKMEKFKKSKLVSRSTSNIFKGLESEGNISVSPLSEQTSPSKKKYGSVGDSATVSKSKGKSVGKSVSSFFMKKSTSKDSLIDEASTLVDPNNNGIMNLNSSNGSIGTISSASLKDGNSTVKKKEDSFKSKIDSFFKGSSSSKLKMSTDVLAINNSSSTTTSPQQTKEVDVLQLNPNYMAVNEIGSDLSDLSDDYDSDFDDDDESSINGSLRRKPVKSKREHHRSESNTSTKSSSSVDLGVPAVAKPIPILNGASTSPATGTESPFTNIDSQEIDSEDMKKMLERRLQRRPTVHELNADNILTQNEYEDVAVAQKQIEIKNQKLFVGTRPAKKVLFYNQPQISNDEISNNSNSNASNENTTTSNATGGSNTNLTKLLNTSNPNIDELTTNICMLLVSKSSGWKRECDMDDGSLPKQQRITIAIEEIENEFPHYLESFCKDKHKNYYAYDPSFVPSSDSIGPVLISIKRDAERTTNYRKLKKKKDKSKKDQVSSSSTKDQQAESSANDATAVENSAERKFKTIIRTREGEDRFYLSSGKASPRELINTIKSFFLPQLSELAFKKIPNNSESRKLLQYWESAQMTKEYKIGLLYRKNGQTDENDFFSNQDQSKEYQEFLEFIGEKIRLKGWDQYKGGLDVKNDSTGLHSIHATKEVTINENSKIKYQLMFHVSTLLPYNSNDLQQLERKRHIGNDIVVIIFQDCNTSPQFSPSMIKSEFNHVFIVVQPHKKDNDEEVTKYSVSVTYKDGVSNFGPTFSSSKVWKKDNVFLDYLMTKLINGEKASYYSPAFCDKMKRTRLNLLMNVVNTFNNSE